MAAKARAASPKSGRRTAADKPNGQAATGRARRGESGSTRAALGHYRRKRDFTKTAEPSGREAAAPQGNLFIVQKHAASHLHYDFRLEHGGVLLSWAIPRGPSVDPAVKRLAAQTEDHPLAYGSFEGTIPKGQYGGGTVMLWDRGTWEPLEDPREGLKEGRLKFILHGKKMKGMWTLVRMKPRPQDRTPQWLLIKDRDEAAHPGEPDALLVEDKSVKTGRAMDAIAQGDDVWISDRAEKRPKADAKKRAPAKRKRTKAPPAFIAPQLATRVDNAPEGDGWVHEIKLDGYRLHGRLDGGGVTILTRRDEDWTDRFAELRDALRRIDADTAYIDGEAVVLDGAGRSDFSALQNWFTTGEGAFAFYAFDLLFLDGEDLRARPLIERKAALRTLIERLPGTVVRYSDHHRGGGSEFFRAASKMGLEGILSKKAEAAYVSGRSRDWLKIKRINRQEFVIGGFMRSTVSDTSIGALLLGEYQGDRLVYVGKVGTGYTHETAAQLFERLSKLKMNKPRFENVPREAARNAVWVKPKLVAEIEFTAWTSDHILRHAAFLGLREDKAAREVKVEKEARLEDVEPPPPKRKMAASKVKPREARTGKSGDAEVLGVSISHPERVSFPAEKLTKLDVAEYYVAVGEHMLPHVANRPLALVRCPDGIGAACFFQKHAGAGLPEAIREVRVGPRKVEDTVLVIDSVEGLVSLVQRSVLEVHIWGSHLGTIEQPDLLVFDFDPDPAIKWPGVVKAAFDMRDFLEDMGLESFTKTTGGKGLHVVLPIKPVLEWEAIKQFTMVVAERFAARDPSRYLINMSKKKREGRIFIDYLRNGRGATAVAPYSTRARPGGLIATPVSWKELKDGAVPQDFTIRTVPERLGKRFRDPWAEMGALKQSITVEMIEALSK